MHACIHVCRYSSTERRRKKKAKRSGLPSSCCCSGAPNARGPALPPGMPHRESLRALSPPPAAAPAPVQRESFQGPTAPKDAGRWEGRGCKVNPSRAATRPPRELQLRRPHTSSPTAGCHASFLDLLVLVSWRLIQCYTAQEHPKCFLAKRM